MPSFAEPGFLHVPTSRCSARCPGKQPVGTILHVPPVQFVAAPPQGLMSRAPPTHLPVPALQVPSGQSHGCTSRAPPTQAITCVCTCDQKSHLRSCRLPSSIRPTVLAASGNPS